MKEQLQKRLESLKAEYEAGQKMLVDLEMQQDNLRQTLLRISGAIQVIEEELANAENEENGNSRELDRTPTEIEAKVEAVTSE